MKQSEPVLTPSESLQLIAGVLAGTNNQVRNWRFYFLLWGWLIFAASVLFYVLKEVAGVKLFFLPFPILVITGIVVSMVQYRKNRHSSEGYADQFLQKLWMVLGLAFIVVVLVSIVRQLPPFTYTMVIGGIGTLVTGMLIRFRPMVVGGVVFLAMAVASVFVADAYKPLMQAAAVLSGYLLPGYLYKNEKTTDV
ncbi:hypothetical protein HHL16_12115 [Pseudoflavitalea sp. G-6-1-2]|uniref:hypothetical protein n=1 Tax=Pseudoflavitalea sp. G-6-1-2 TaxID=2728841 RepID=UPI00146E3EBD|nr:hypothetical protein [Pseudoflavitalea sp. G-6-1-2]NML21626.1 hypothetical protein [Pseudoflavitalea sp. G-6-1-2]